MNAKPINARRRLFLTVAACAPAIAVAAVLTRQKSVVQAVAPPLEPLDSVGYHETEHIRKYYRSFTF